MSKLEDGCVYLTAEEALSLIPADAESVHTFSNPSPGILLGFDREVEDIKQAIVRAETIRIGGSNCRGMGHGLVLYDGQCLYVEVDDAALQAIEDAAEETKE
jgi:hypothetical protein